MRGVESVIVALSHVRQRGYSCYEKSIRGRVRWWVDVKLMMCWKGERVAKFMLGRRVKWGYGGRRDHVRKSTIFASI